MRAGYRRAIQIVEKSHDVAVLRLTRSQIIVLNNAMNEVLHGPEAIEDWEFHTRIGVTRREAEAVLKGIAGALGHGGGIA